MLLEGRVALVSGIGPGMGRSIALACAREGADIVMGARTPEKLDAVAADVEELGRKVVSRPTNVVRDEDCRALADLAMETFGRIDVLVNNAFVHTPFRTIEEAPMDDWNLAHKVNVVGTLQMTRAVIPAMKDRGEGSIVMVSSMSARTGEPRSGAYAATKAAMLSAVRVLARELGPDGIRVNAVVPGHIWGPSLQIYFDHLASERGCDPKEIYDEVASEAALRKIPDSDEIADTVLFLASDLARVVTGQALDVNAGAWFD